MAFVRWQKYNVKMKSWRTEGNWQGPEVTRNGNVRLVSRTSESLLTPERNWIIKTTPKLSWEHCYHCSSDAGVHGHRREGGRTCWQQSSVSASCYSEINAWPWAQEQQIWRLPDVLWNIKRKKVERDTGSYTYI